MSTENYEYKLYILYSSVASQVLTFITSFLLGLVDSALNTQVNFLALSLFSFFILVNQRDS